MNGPDTVTELGAIAYRLDALATEIYARFGPEVASPLWGVVDDIVAYGMAHPAPATPDLPVVS